MRARRCLIIAALLAAGCGGAGQPSALAPSLPADVRAMAGTADDAAVLELAQSILIARCMTGQGFSYPLDADAARADLSSARAATSTALSWPEDDEANAARDGLAPPQPSRAPVTALENYVRGLDSGRQRAFSLALYGDLRSGSPVSVTLPGREEIQRGEEIQQSTDGCNSQAQRELLGDLEGYLRGRLIADNVGTLAQAKVTAHPAFIAAEHEWRTCMAGQGWPVVDQAELAARVAEAGATLSPDGRSRLERPAAVIAARCNRQSGLSTTGRRLTPAAVREARGDVAPLLADLDRRERTALPHARQLVAGATP